MPPHVVDADHEVHPPALFELVIDERKEHAEGALGEVEDTRGAEREHQSIREQGVDRAEDGAQEECRNQGVHRPPTFERRLVGSLMRPLTCPPSHPHHPPPPPPPTTSS